MSLLITVSTFVRAQGRLAVSDAIIDNQEKLRTHACHDRQALSGLHKPPGDCTVVLDLYKPKPKHNLKGNININLSSNPRSRVKKKTRNIIAICSYGAVGRKRGDVSMTSSHGALIVAR